MKFILTYIKHVVILASLSAFSFNINCCVSSKDVDASSSVLELDLKEKSKDRALQRFIDGSTLESKGDYANAIIEFQDALRYDDNAAIHFAIAKNYVALNKPSLAAQYAKRAVDLEPDNEHYREQLAEIFVLTFQNDSAIAQYEKMLASNPSPKGMDNQNEQIMFTLARLYSANKPLEALMMYNRLRDYIGDEWDVLYRLSELYGQLGKVDSAIVTMESMLRIDPGNITLRSALAEMYMQSKKTEQARQMYLDLIDRDPKEYRYSIALAEIERRDGHWDKAVEIYNKLLRDDSLRVEGKMLIGEALFQNSISDSVSRPFVLRVLNQLKEKYPQDWHPYWYLGAFKFNNREYADAIFFLKKVLEIDQKNFQAFNILARTYLSLNDYEQARTVLESAVEIDTANAEMLSLLGFAYSRLSLNEKIVQTLERALRINPKQMDALSTLALTLDGMKNFQYSDSLYESAIKVYESGLEKDETYYLLLNNFAYSLSERSLQLQRALEMSKRAIDFEKENSAYLDTYGWIFFQLEKYDEALKYILQAIDIRENKEKQPAPALYEHAGDIYFKMGDKEKAMIYWRKALDQDKTNTALQGKVAKGSL